MIIYLKREKMAKKIQKKIKGYVDRFFSLNCSGDVLNVLGKFSNPSKEITESMSIIKQMKDLTIKKPMEYTMLDLCAGNCLTSVLAAHLLPIKHAYAIDIREKGKRFDGVNRFSYLKMDMKDPSFISNLSKEVDLNAPIIITGVHACKDLALEIIHLHKTIPNSHLFLMPCCKGQINHAVLSIPSGLQKRFTKYELWSWYLANEAQGDFIIDKGITSPCNIIVKA